MPEGLKEIMIVSQRAVRLLLDCREFGPARRTGISRVVEGLAFALSVAGFVDELVLAVRSPESIPADLRASPRVRVEVLPRGFLGSESTLTRLTRTFSLYISPYPKLPLFGCRCKSVHIIHDTLDLTYPAYRKRLKRPFDAWRLKRALKSADLTWYDSFWGLEGTRKYVGFIGHNPRVRPPGIDDAFVPEVPQNYDAILRKYRLESGYVLVIGNGLPHKNLGTLLKVGDCVKRRFVFAGVSEENQRLWKSRYPLADASWIEHVAEADLPAIIKGAFCLAQPSTMEGYGYPPLEAMACGVPAVVSDIPVLIETMGGNALTADPAEPKAWIEAFMALEDEARYKGQVDEGLKWVEPLRGRRGWHKHVSDIEEMLVGL